MKRPKDRGTVLGQVIPVHSWLYEQAPPLPEKRQGDSLFVAQDGFRRVQIVVGVERSTSVRGKEIVTVSLASFAAQADPMRRGEPPRGRRRLSPDIIIGLTVDSTSGALMPDEPLGLTAIGPEGTTVLKSVRPYVRVDRIAKATPPNPLDHLPYLTDALTAPDTVLVAAIAHPTRFQRLARASKVASRYY